MSALAVVLAAAAVGAVLAAQQTRADAATASARTAAVAAARQHTADILSYAAGDKLSAQLARAKAGTTGAFRSDFDTLAAKLIGPAVTQSDVSTSAKVASAGVVSATRDQVVTLLFVDQVTRSAKTGKSNSSSSRVRVTMTDTNGSWLVSDLRPV
jgi:Mce-associated membrane protein